MDTRKQNCQFDATEGLTKAQKALLVSEGRIATTRAWMTSEEAVQAIGPSALDASFGKDGRGKFIGYIITREPMSSAAKATEAARIAAQRPFGEETVLGVLLGTVPKEDEEGGSDFGPSRQEIRSN